MLRPGEIIVDSFAGGGGASLGIMWALGRSPDIAINHDKEAIALHAANHPESIHLAEDVWAVDPVEACAGRPVGLMWLSPDCKHFSKAKGGKPVSKKIRGLAWVAARWAKAVRPRIIVLENVEEFQTWGPLDPATNRPYVEGKGKTFRAFLSRLRSLGYEIQFRELRACDYGTPTIRKRLFIIARCDGQPIVWPRPTHGKGLPLPWRTAAECIEWSVPCPSIFTRKKPLAENTLKRIARGIDRFVINSPQPFIVPFKRGEPFGLDRPINTLTGRDGFGLVTPYMVQTAHGEQDSNGKKRGRGEHTLEKPLGTVTASGDAAVVAPYLVPRYGERKGQEPRTRNIREPMPTIVPTSNGAGLVAAFLAKHYTTSHDSASLFAPMPTVTAVDHNALVTSNLINLRGTHDSQLCGRSVTEPLPTISGGGIHAAEVRAFLVAYYGNEKDGGDLFDPMRTVTSKERFGLVTVEGVEYLIADIGMRMLIPRELYRAQGFPDSYRIDIPFNGKPLTKTAQVRMVGNSVCPPMAAAIVSANFGTAQTSDIGVAA